MVQILWTERDSALFLIAVIHWTTNFKTYEQGNSFSYPQNTQSSSEESLNEKRHKFIGICTLFTWLSMEILNLCNRWYRRIHSPLNYLKWSVLQKSWRLKVVNFFRNALHLKCLSGFWISFWMIHRDLTDQANVCYCENQVLL